MHYVKSFLLSPLGLWISSTPGWSLSVSSPLFQLSSQCLSPSCFPAASQSISRCHTLSTAASPLFLPLHVWEPTWRSWGSRVCHLWPQPSTSRAPRAGITWTTSAEACFVEWSRLKLRERGGEGGVTHTRGRGSKEKEQTTADGQLSFP